MAESDPANLRVRMELSAIEKGIKLVKELGFPIAIALFLLYDRLSVMKQFEATMMEVKILLQEVRMELKDKRQ